MTAGARTPAGSAGSPVAAFDPGYNVGYALVDRDGEPRVLRILRLGELEAVEIPDGAEVVVGAGTGRAAVVGALEARGLRVRTVDERNTSLLARELWRRHTPRRGLTRWVPAGLRTPPGPIDDHAAWAIALRHLGLEPREPPGR